MPREAREQCAAWKQAQAEMRARQQAVELARALERRQEFSHDNLQTIRGRSRASELTIRATTAAAEVNASLLTIAAGQSNPKSDSSFCL
jgi:hypothetical protein